MPVYEVLIQWCIACCSVAIFTGMGSLAARMCHLRWFNSINFGYAWYSWHLLLGLLAALSVYALVQTQGKTIMLPVLPLLYWLGRTMPPKQSIGAQPQKTFNGVWIEMPLVALVSLLLLHLFPEAEPKQADAFYYLKMAESLHLAGQENVSHYYNLFNPAFHGAEPYHYPEIWLTALISSITRVLMPSIWVQRFITQSIFLVGVIFTLYALAARVVQQPLRWYHKLFCWSILFIFPNILHFVPALYHVFISDFEGNLLDRPNFRMVYWLWLLIAWLLTMQRSITTPVVVLFALLAVITFQTAVVLFPAAGLFIIAEGWRQRRLQLHTWLPLLLTGIFMAVFYWLFSPSAIPSFLSAGAGRQAPFPGLKQLLFAGFATAGSVVYILLLVAMLLLPVLLWRTRRCIKSFRFKKKIILLFGAIACCGIVLARLFYLKDNAYQFLFVAHVLATIFVWLVYLRMLRASRQAVVLLVTAFITMGWWVHLAAGHRTHTNIFKQNSQLFYTGNQYSSTYLRATQQMVNTAAHSIGAFVGYPTYYASPYYSLRNPNVYFPPSLYIWSSTLNGLVTINLSDSATMLTGITEPVHKNYLQNAIRRSLFYRFQSQHSNLAHQQQVLAFIQQYKPAYLVLSPGADAGFVVHLAKKQVVDTATGEQFLLLRQQ